MPESKSINQEIGPFKLKDKAAFAALVESNLRAAIARMPVGYWVDGEQWYPRMFANAAALGDRTGISTYTAAAVTSAISLQRWWERNESDAECVVLTFQAFPELVVESREDLPKRSFRKYNALGNFPVPAGWECIFKAWRILQGREVTWDSDGCPKTSDFLELGGVNPHNPHTVVCDSHHLRIAIGHLEVTGTLKCTPWQYLVVADVTRKIAAELGRLPSVVQAALWCYRRDLLAGKVA